MMNERPSPGAASGIDAGVPDTPEALDAALVRVARGQGAIDLALGETLLLLFAGGGLIDLGYSRQVDYARERLGLPARTMFLFTRLARGLADLPLLRRAVACGAVSPRKALAVMPVAAGEAEPAWTAAAMSVPLAELERAVRTAGGEPPTALFEVETLLLRMTPPQQDRLDAAIEVSWEVIGFGAPRWQCLEAIAQEWLGTFPACGPKEGSGAASGEEAAAAYEAWRREWSGQADSVLRELAAMEEAAAVVEGVDGEAGTDPRALDARARRLLQARKGFDEPFGRLAELVFRTGTWRSSGHRTFAEYCRERLGMAERTVRERIWLEQRMCALPEIREALGSGRLTFSKALLVAKDARPEDVEERIEEATSRTWQQVERESTAEEDRRNRAAGVRRLWGPKDAMETVVLAIASAQAEALELGERLEAGEALAVIADHFVAVWGEHVRRRRESRARREVLRRHGGLCAVPGCSRAAEQEHHVQFRSLGGSDEVENRIGVCAPHHLHGIHRGHLEVRGRAGERLVWRLGSSELLPLEVWETEGDDDVRRLE